jgi:hypothetical protein
LVVFVDEAELVDAGAWIRISVGEAVETLLGGDVPDAVDMLA